VRTYQLGADTAAGGGGYFLPVLFLIFIITVVGFGARTFGEVVRIARVLLPIELQGKDRMAYRKK
jgi:hypothetical protein